MTATVKVAGDTEKRGGRPADIETASGVLTSLKWRKFSTGDRLYVLVFFCAAQEKISSTTTKTTKLYHRPNEASWAEYSPRVW